MRIWRDAKPEHQIDQRFFFSKKDVKENLWDAKPEHQIHPIFFKEKIIKDTLKKTLDKKFP